MASPAPIAPSNPPSNPPSAHLHIDFETYSRLDLKQVGLDRYSKDPSTGVHCMSYAFDDEAVLCWRPRSCDIERVRDHVNAGGLVFAHNAPFELALWNEIQTRKFGWPRLDPKQVRCTMAMAYAMALPGSLENAAPALGLEMRKDAKGKTIMLRLCKPRTAGKQKGELWVYEDDPEAFEALYRYCDQDVEVERALAQRLLPLSDYEQQVWQLDYKINQTGVLVDIPSIGKAMTLIAAEKTRLDGEMLRVTDGAVNKCTEVQLIVQWLRLEGVEVSGLAKADVLEALSLEGMPPKAKLALELRQEAAKSSTAKMLAMKNRAADDCRVRGVFQYHGAGTGRWAGRGIQLQNLPRPRHSKVYEATPENIADILSHLDDRDYIDMWHGPVLASMADCVRSLIVAPQGCDLIACDYSAIEARTVAWLAGQENSLEVFRTTGKIYEHEAGGIYHVSPEEIGKHDPRRQIGKVAVLALGYGGGLGAFQTMAKTYQVVVSDAEAESIKKAWRAAHPQIVQYWYDLDRAAIAALQGCGVQRVRNVAFCKSGSFLLCKLPSGRLLTYPYPEIRQVKTPWGAMRDAVTYMTVTDPARKLKFLNDPAACGNWQRISTYGGSLCENVTQAVARDLLADAMLRLSERGVTIVAHVHDEVVLEIPETAGLETLKRIEILMAEAPAWADGLPLAAEGFRAKRYRK